MSVIPSEICFYGCGNMGSAMLRGWLASGEQPGNFAVVDPLADSFPAGVQVYRSSQEVGRRFDIIVLGIKPQLLPSLVPDIAQLLASGAMVISILAGAMTQTLSAAFPEAVVVRLMPNLAAAIGKSPIALHAPQVHRHARSALETMLAPLGSVIWIENEGEMDAVTALAGSGPAFVYRFIDALAKGGEAAGLPRDIAAHMAIAMTEGAAILAASSGHAPEDLAARVTSPGGTTAAGLAVLDAGGALNILVGETLRAARDRGTQLAGGDNK